MGYRFPIRRGFTVRLTALAFAPAVAAGCVDAADTPTSSTPPPLLTQVSTVECQASTAAGTLRCEPADPSGLSTGTTGSPGPRFLRVFGGQGRYIRLTSSNVVYESGVFSFNVTVQNLSSVSMATTNGATRHSQGVRVFFDHWPVVLGGKGSIWVMNPTGSATFTSGNQDYFQYGGTIGAVNDGALGSDGILASSETSAAKRWELSVPSTVESFAFILLIATETPTGGALTTIAPQIDSITPHPMVTSSTATIFGRNFSPGPGNVVTIAGTSAFVTSATSTVLQVTVPCVPTDSVAEVQVTVTAGANDLKGSIFRHPVVRSC